MPNFRYTLSVQLFGPLHLSLLLGIALLAIVLSWLSRVSFLPRRTLRLFLGVGLSLIEVIRLFFRYAKEGVHLSNLPLQLCDISIWATVVACLVLTPTLVEFAYFAGIAGSSMALLTPDLDYPWPALLAVLFFVTHGGIVVTNSILVYGRIASLRKGALWRAFGIFLGFAAIIGLFNAIFKTNYLYLCHKPKSASLLDSLGPWPLYLIPSFGLSFLLYVILWIPGRTQVVTNAKLRAEAKKCNASSLKR